MSVAHIKITKLVAISDERGDVFEWCKGLEGRQVTIYTRKAGAMCGEHFHKGDDPSKNPERFLLVSGQIEFKAWDKEGGEINEIIEPGTELIIPPMIAHSMKAITDIIFIEYRSTVFDVENPDTYPNQEF